MAEPYQEFDPPDLSPQGPPMRTLRCVSPERMEELLGAETEVVRLRADNQELTEERDDYAARLKATDQSWSALAADRDRLAAVIEQVRALHQPLECVNVLCPHEVWCGGCDPNGDCGCNEHPWPCPTAALLPPAPTPGSNQPPAADVIELTATEYREAVDHTLTALGYTRHELAAMAATGDFAGPVAFMAWQMCRDVPPPEADHG